MNALQQIYDAVIANNKFLVNIEQRLAYLEHLLDVNIDTDNQHSEEDAGQQNN